MDEFKGKLGIYKVIVTEDNTQTVWSEYFSEACHNLSGAREETHYNYIQGCHLPEFVKAGLPLHILDVGFGVGMGLACLIEFVEKNSFGQISINYTSIELDDTFADWSLAKFLPILKLTRKTEVGLTFLHGNYKNIIIKIFLGDGRVTLPLAIEQKLIPKFNIIFQDPFSPKKNPTLWTVEWFLFLKNSSDQNIRLSTYSASVSIRKSMVTCGWIIENHRGFGNKKSMTQASLIGTIESVLLDQLARSPIQELHDLEIQSN